MPERQEGHGYLMKNDYKSDGDNRPDYTGKIMLDGSDKQIAAWIKTAKSGQKFMSLKVSELREGKPAPANDEKLDDKIPF